MFLVSGGFASLTPDQELCLWSRGIARCRCKFWNSVHRQFNLTDQQWVLHIGSLLLTGESSIPRCKWLNDLDVGLSQKHRLSHALSWLLKKVSDNCVRGLDSLTDKASLTAPASDSILPDAPCTVSPECTRRKANCRSGAVADDVLSQYNSKGNSHKLCSAARCWYMTRCGDAFRQDTPRPIYTRIHSQWLHAQRIFRFFFDLRRPQRLPDYWMIWFRDLTRKPSWRKAPKVAPLDRPTPKTWP